ncbi:hypothetical protein cyc_09196 [Cyclospora cayetanensis]|uniref:NFACT RNA-binding domain-containing protein n=1 Tax=Cyclospora cayetanensis TaxID=88456 RepID=A0A1D3CWT0_9EIME|nr:hypothetical protein cyc_09196 [Cyclospora cayetanensis]
MQSLRVLFSYCCGEETGTFCVFVGIGYNGGWTDVFLARTGGEGGRAVLVLRNGYLVIAGRDAHQNELLFRRYLQQQDLYVHGDIHGAATCVIKTALSTADAASVAADEAPVPPPTLQQAAEFAVCRSSAWQSKAPVGAWWVWGHQVSKAAPSGLYLSTGAFMIRGKRHFVSVHRLEMGLTILWRLDVDAVYSSAYSHEAPSLAASCV